MISLLYEREKLKGLKMKPILKFALSVENRNG
jgi:hypothetical protein